MISNPYPSHRVDGHVIRARVSAADYHFLKRLFPYVNGISDKVLSTLFKKLIDELRKEHSTRPFTIDIFGNDGGGESGPDSNGPDPTYSRVESILAEFQRCTVGDPTGLPSPRDDDATTGGVRKAVRRPAKQRSVKKGSDQGNAIGETKGGEEEK